MLGSGDDDHPRQTSKLQLEHAAAEGSQSIVPAPLILLRSAAGAARRAPRFRHFLDETRREHTLNGAVQRAGSHPDLPLRHFLDFLRNRIAVTAHIVVLAGVSPAI